MVLCPLRFKQHCHRRSYSGLLVRTQHSFSDMCDPSLHSRAGKVQKGYLKGKAGFNANRTVIEVSSDEEQEDRRPQKVMLTWSQFFSWYGNNGKDGFSAKEIRSAWDVWAAEGTHKINGLPCVCVEMWMHPHEFWPNCRMVAWKPDASA